jgi:hypothetical protein
MLNHTFEVVDGRIYLVLNFTLLGNSATDRYDVTDEVTEAFNKALLD